MGRGSQFRACHCSTTKKITMRVDTSLVMICSNVGSIETWADETRPPTAGDGRDKPKMRGDGRPRSQDTTHIEVAVYTRGVLLLHSLFCLLFVPRESCTTARGVHAAGAPAHASALLQTRQGRCAAPAPGVLMTGMPPAGPLGPERRAGGPHRTLWPNVSPTSHLAAACTRESVQHARTSEPTGARLRSTQPKNG